MGAGQSATEEGRVRELQQIPRREWRALSYDILLGFGDRRLAPTLEGADRLQKSGQSCDCLVLWNCIQFLKRAGECVREAPHSSLLELFINRL